MDYLDSSKKKISHWQNTVDSQINGKEFKEFHKSRHEGFIERIENGEYLYDDLFYKRCNSILKQIVEANPAYANLGVLEVLINRSSEPNAACYGNGVFEFNLGLISRLQNDDQLAFVIAHEFSHQILDHVDKGVKSKLEYIESKEFKQKLKEIDKLDYNRNTTYDNFMLEINLKWSYNSRGKEIEADSLAIVLLQNTNFKISEGLNSLGILDKIDQPKFNDSIDYKSIFSSTESPFQDEWIRKKNGLNVQQEYNKELIDSLKSHPNCSLRIRLLENYFNLPPFVEHGVDTEFKYLAEMADFELISSSLASQRYASVITNSIILLESYPEQEFLKSAIGISIAKIYFAQKNHQLRKYVPLPDDRYSSNYHRMLLLVENIRLSELRALSASYLERNNFDKTPNLDSTDEYKAYAHYLYLKLKSKENLEAFKDQYINQYPNGFYINQLK